MRRTIVAVACLSLLAASPSLMASAAPPSPPAAPAAPAAPQVPAGFQDRLAIGGLSEPTAVAFAPDGTAFVALKNGRIKSFDYDSTRRVFEPYVTSTDFADLSTNVMNYWDRGLTGIVVYQVEWLPPGPRLAGWWAAMDGTGQVQNEVLTFVGKR